jgi:hypothetical protein
MVCILFGCSLSFAIMRVADAKTAKYILKILLKRKALKND